MKFLREITVDNISDVVINDLTNKGFTLVWKQNSIEVWYETNDKAV